MMTVKWAWHLTIIGIEVALVRMVTALTLLIELVSAERKVRGGKNLLNERFRSSAALPSKLSVFLSSASRYPSLALQEDGEEKQAVLKPPSRSSSRRIILLEDLPNLSHFPTRSAFLATLEAFLEQSGDCNTPLVVILSESAPHLDDWGTEESRRNFKDHKRESLSVRSTIPHEIRYHAAFANIG